MKSLNENIEVLNPKNQLNLFGYKRHFNSIAKLFDKKKMPNSVLFSGQKGIGKATLAYHMINYLLSKEEDNKYVLNDNQINKENLSYKLLNSYTHPNFFLVENTALEKNIKIEQVRNLIKFLNKSTYSRDLKIIMIDNAECLNLNSSNALLKAIEEPQENTFFFIIHNSSYKISDTLKSRCTEFKFSLSIKEKKDIFSKALEQYKSETNANEIIENFYFETPGNLLKLFLFLDSANIDVKNDTLKSIFFFIEKYNKEKNSEHLTFLSFFIEKFYFELISHNNKNLNSYYFNLYRILKQIDDMRKFNLNEKNIFIWIKDILHNDTK